MSKKIRMLAVALLIAGLLPATPVLAKKGQGQGPGQGQPQGQSYGPPSYAGPKGDSSTPPYGPPSYAGPKAGKQGKNRSGDVMQPMGQGQYNQYNQQNQHKKHKKHKKHGPPDHAPAWGYRNQQ